MTALETRASTQPPVFRYLFLTSLWVVALVVMLVFTARLLQPEAALGFIASFRQYVVLAEVVIFGVLAVESGAAWLYGLAVRRISTDTAAAIRIVVRIVAYALILSTVVSILTANAAAALTLGSFAGLVVGFASQSVMGHVLAGIFLALMRPIRIGDNVTIAGQTGQVIEITMMHTVLETEEKRIKIPSGSVVNSILTQNVKAGS